MQGMTKRELQITDMDQIRAILDKATVLRLGLAVNNEPYIVPMNYGYLLEDGKLTFYLHSAMRGKKLDMIRANPKVFIELDCDLTPFEGIKVFGRCLATVYNGKLVYASDKLTSHVNNLEDR